MVWEGHLVKTMEEIITLWAVIGWWLLAIVTICNATGLGGPVGVITLPINIWVLYIYAFWVDNHP